MPGRGALLGVLLLMTSDMPVSVDGLQTEEAALPSVATHPKWLIIPEAAEVKEDELPVPREVHFRPAPKPPVPPVPPDPNPVIPLAPPPVIVPPTREFEDDNDRQRRALAKSVNDLFHAPPAKEQAAKNAYEKQRALAKSVNDLFHAPPATETTQKKGRAEMQPLAKVVNELFHAPPATAQTLINAQERQRNLAKAVNALFHAPAYISAAKTSNLSIAQSYAIK